MFTLRVDEEVELTLMEERHADAMQAVVERNLEHLRRWLPWVGEGATRDQLVAWIRLNLQRFAEGDGWFAAIRQRGEIAGSLGLEVDRRQRSAEIGYWLDRDRQGEGLITRSVRAVTGACFDDLGLHRVVIRCAVANERSCAVARRLGFVHEGTLRGAERIEDRYHDLHVYGMLAEDWS